MGVAIINDTKGKKRVGSHKKKFYNDQLRRLQSVSSYCIIYDLNIIKGVRFPFDMVLN